MYNEKDFDNLPWNPLKTKKGVQDKWKGFKAYKEFGYPLGKLDKDLFFNYMCLVYHKDSVLVADFDNAKDRKHKALDLLGVPHENDKYPKPIEAMIDHENESADLMIIRFCSLLNNQRYTFFITLGMSYDRLMKRIYEATLNADINDAIKDIGGLRKNAEEMLKTIDALKKELFGNDAEVASKADEEVLSYARVPGYAELIAHSKIEI